MTGGTASGTTPAGGGDWSSDARWSHVGGTAAGVGTPGGTAGATTAGTITDPTVEIEAAFTPGVWTPLTARVHSVRIRRGRSDEFDEPTAGTLIVEADNSDRALDPTYVASPWYPRVQASVPIRVRACYGPTPPFSVPLFSGRVDMWQQQPAEGGSYGQVVITASDSLADLARQPYEKRPVFRIGDPDYGVIGGAGKIPGTPKFSAAHRSGERAAAILAATGSTDIEADRGRSIIPAGTHDGTVLDALRDCVRSELGTLFCTASGTISFRERRSRRPRARSPQAVLSDQAAAVAAGAIPYAAVVLDPATLTYVRNVAIRDVEGYDRPVTARNQASVDRYGELVDEETIYATSRSAALQQARYVVGWWGTPRLRVTALEMNVRRDPATMFAAVCGVDLGDRVTVEHTPQGVGAGLVQDSIVEGVEHDIAARPERAWVTRWTVSVCDTRPVFTVGRSAIGGTDQIAY